MLPTLVDEPSTGPAWQHEIKHDGYRPLLLIESGSGTSALQEPPGLDCGYPGNRHRDGRHSVLHGHPGRRNMRSRP
jgi:hypothetical protein